MKHTKGKWTVRFLSDEKDADFFVQAPRNIESDPYDIEILGEDDGGGLYPREQRLADAKLIAEAGTVANETGYSPRELADQKAELLEACIALMKSIDNGLDVMKSMDMATKAINNATE